MRRYVLASTTIFALLLLLVQSTHAHSESSLFTVFFKDIQTIPNNVTSDTTHTDFVITEDIAPETYLTHEQVSFTAIPTRTDDTDTYLWTFSDGQTLSGRTVERSFSSPGSYRVALSTSLDPTQKHTVLMHVLSDKNYPLPMSLIVLDGAKTQTESVIEKDLTKPITFSPEPKRGDYTYLWYVDGEIKTGDTIVYTYQNPPFITSPILRTIDKQGIYTDTTISLKNSAFGKKRFPLTLVILLTGVGLLTLFIIFRILTRKKR